MRRKKVLHHCFLTSPSRLFSLDADKGSIRIRTGEGDEIRVEVCLDVRAGSEAEAREMLERVEIAFLEPAAGPIVRSRVAAAERPGLGFWRRHGEIDVTLSVTLPVLLGRQDLRVENGAGEIEVSGVRGNLRLCTHAGAIRVADVDGAVYAKTGTGDISLRQITGGLQATTGTGSISARIERQPQADGEITTHTGSVSIALADNAGLYLDAASRVGRVTSRIPSLSGSSWMGGAIRSAVHGGGPQLTVRTGVGQVLIQSFSPSL